MAEKYADKYGIEKIIFKPDYKRYKKNAPLIRNKMIVQNADLVIAIWNGKSKGTKFVLDYAMKTGKAIKIILIDVTGVEIIPGNMGNDCPGNGKFSFEACCDECDYLMCCIYIHCAQSCINCSDVYCPRKYK